MIMMLLGAVVKGQSPSLRDSTTHADYVVICAEASAKQAERLAQFRLSHSNLTTKVVLTESIYSEFKFGAPDSSVRDFIRFALNHWRAPVPRYFVLAGNVNTVPSHKEPGLQIGPGQQEDSILVDRWFIETENGGQAPAQSTVSLGRLPGWTTGQLDTLISKTISYDEAAAESWMSRMVTVADYNEADGDIFEWYAGALQASLSRIWPDTTLVHVRANSLNHSDVRGFLNNWSSGAAIVTFVGHASPWSFSKSAYLRAADISLLSNISRLSVCFFEACSQTYYKPDSASIVERLLVNRDGGAVATIGSTGEIFLTEASSFFQQLGMILLANRSVTLGDAFARAATAPTINFPGSTTRRLTLLGDPAIVPKRPSVTSHAPTGAKVPREFVLSQNYPNPFNSSTVISFELPAASHVSLKIFDLLGREIGELISSDMSIGKYKSIWSPSALASGVYYYRLQTQSWMQYRKLIYTK